MSNRSRLSPEQLERVAAMRESGQSCERIARTLTREGTPISKSAISWQCLRIGADVPVARQKPTGGERRSGRGRAFTAVEDARLLALVVEGASRPAIARELGRNCSSINGRLLTLARAEARAEIVG